MSHDRTLSAKAVALAATLLALSPAAGGQERGPVGEPPADPDVLVGYVVSVDGDTLVLSNVPTVDAARVFQLGGGQMFIAGPEGETTDPAAGEGGERRMVFRRQADPSAAAEVEAETEAEGEATTETEAEAEEATAVEVRTEREGEAETSETEEGEPTRVFQATPGSTWVSAGDGAAALPDVDTPLEIQQVRLSPDVQGRDMLIPGLQVRLHLRGEGDERAVATIELVIAQDPGDASSR